MSVSSLQRRADNARFAELDAETMPALNALKLDLTRTTFIGKKGDLLCFLTDMDMGARQKQTALLMAHKRDPRLRQVSILFSQLWVLIDPKVQAGIGISEQVAAKATLRNIEMQRHAIRSLTERLYGFVTSDDETRVIDAVFDCYLDIQHAKPPTWMSKAEWLHALAEDDMTVFENGIAVNR